MTRLRNRQRGAGADFSAGEPAAAVLSRKEVDAPLELSRAVVQLFEQSPGFMVFLHGPEHRIAFTNPAGVIMAGDRHTLGLTVKEAFPEVAEQGFLAMLDEVFRSGKAITARGARYDRMDRGVPTRFYLDFVYQPVFEDDGRIAGIWVQGFDVTERTLAERALIEARNAAEAAEISKADFIAQLSHNIRAPLSGIVSLANLLNATAPLTREQAEYIRALLMSAETILSQANDMVDTARIEAHLIELEVSAFSPAEMIRQTVDSFAAQAKEKNLTLAIEILCDEKERLAGDTRRIGQILNQVVSNAIRFTNTGNVWLTVATESSKPGQRLLTVTVADTGVGIAPDRIVTLFQISVERQASAKRRYGGTGLGLSIVKALCDIMGGTVAVQSRIDKGSVFTVGLPLPVATMDEGLSPETEEQAATATATAAEDLSILLVEDYEPNILIATTFLKRAGYRVDVATNGLAAVEKTRTGTYALALMDIQMPGINGLEATRLIREEEAVQGRQRLPIIGATAHALAVDRERCLEAGMDEVLPKPFDADDLLGKIATVLAAMAA